LRLTRGSRAARRSLNAAHAPNAILAVFIGDHKLIARGAAARLFNLVRNSLAFALDQGRVRTHALAR